MKFHAKEKERGLLTKCNHEKELLTVSHRTSLSCPIELFRFANAMYRQGKEGNYVELPQSLLEIVFSSYRILI